MSKFILLWLEGPLQSWGSESLFNRRETGAFPTMSGILGMICSATARDGAQKEFLAEMTQSFLEVISYSRKAENIRERSILDVSKMVDFHMVGSDYNKNDPWQKMMIPKTSDRKSAVGGGAKMTFRYYLQESAFAVILELPNKHEEEIIEGMTTPERTLFLGRRNCIPTDLIFRGVFDAADGARTEAFRIAEQKNRAVKLTASTEGEGDESLFMNDMPVQFGDNKIYSTRKVFITHG